MKAAHFAPGLMLKILHFSHSVCSRPLIHSLSWSWISCTRFLGWSFLQVLVQCSRDPKSPVSTCHLWQEFELSYSFSLNFLTTLFFQNKICLCNGELYLLLLSREHGGVVLYDTIFVFVVTESQNIFNIFIVLVTFFLFCNEASKYSSQDRWQEIWNEYKCEANAGDNWKVRIRFMWDNCMCWVWCKK